MNNRKNRIPIRSGYALLMCLMVVAVSSSIVMTLFHQLRLQTAESMARRQIVISNSLADAAFEHAIALLIDTPTLAGKFAGKVPGDPTRSYVLTLQQISGDVQVVADLTVGSSVQTLTRLITAAELDARRSELGLTSAPPGNGNGNGKGNGGNGKGKGNSWGNA